MLSEICAYLHNYFETGRFIGNISIADGVPYCDGEKIELDDNQYYAVFHTNFCLGVFNGDNSPKNRKAFRGAVWPMDIPEPILKAAEWADKWMELNGAVDSAANSPYQSESFGGYSYSKGSRNSTGAGSSTGTSVFDQQQFIAMINPYKKLGPTR